MPQACSPANTPVSTLLNHAVNVLNASGALLAVLFAGLSVLCLNQLPNHCTGIVQSIRSVLVNKMPSCLTSQTSEL